MRWRVPGRAGLLRAGLCTVLLVTAAGVLYGPQPDPAPTDADGRTVAGAGSAAPPGAGSAQAAGSGGPQPDGRRGAGAPASQPGTAPAGTAPGGSAPGGTGPGGSAPGGTGPGGTGPGATGRGATGSAGRWPVPRAMVGVAVRLAEPSTLAVLHPGDRADLLAVPPGGQAGRLLAARVLVLGVVGDPAVEPGTAAVYLALTPAQARRTVASPDGTRFAALVHP